MNDIFILKTFNAVFFACFLLAVLSGFCFIKKNARKTDRQKRIAVALLYSVIFVIFIIYKIFLSLDAEYSELCVHKSGIPFNWLHELPLNLCNINIFLIVIGVLTGYVPILGFCFYFGSLGALMALVMPDTSFVGYSIFLPRMLGFYICHFAVLLETPMLWHLGLYRPDYRNIPKAFLTLFSLTTVITLFNLFIRHTGWGPMCNYFYSVDPAGIFVFEKLHSLIPIPGIYLLPLSVVVIPFMYLITYLYKQMERHKNWKNQDT